MRYIPKTTRCVAFDQYLATQAPRNWKIFDSNIKLVLHQHLLQEQQHLCIYCQQSIPAKAQKDDRIANPPVLHPSHIEHIRPKGAIQYSHLTFEYTNLAVACNGFEIEPALPPTSPEFCGHPKENTFDNALFLHPFELPDIEGFFEFDVNCQISSSAKEPSKSNYTIQLLSLNKETLREMRERQYLLIIDLEKTDGLDVEAYLDPGQSELPKFFSMLRQLFGLF